MAKYDPDAQSAFAEEIVWCSPEMDSIHLNWGSNANITDTGFDEDPLRILRACGARTRQLSVAFDMIHPLRDKHGKAFSKELLYFHPQERFSAVLGIVCIHASVQQVAKAGIFDQGQSRVALVSLSDRVAFTSYLELGKRTSSLKKQLLKKLSSSAASKKLLATWNSELTKLWVWSRWCALRGVRYFDEAEHGDTCPFTSTEIQDTGFLFKRQLFEHKLKLQDPWVAAEIQSRPRFHPTVMF